MNLSTKYLQAKYLYLSNELAKLPPAFLSIHNGHEIAYIKNTDSPKIQKTQHHTNTKEGAELKEIALLRKKIKHKLKSLTTQYGINTNNIKISIKDDCALPISYRSKFINDSNPYEKKDNYLHNGIQMRSRLEIIIAEILDSLELEYMYEVEININGVVYHPDFVVFLPELGTCFIIECLGKTDDLSYIYRNNERIGLYMYAGLYPNQNLLLFCGTKNSIPTTISIRHDIIHLVNNLAEKLVVYE